MSSSIGSKIWNTIVFYSAGKGAEDQTSLIGDRAKLDSAIQNYNELYNDKDVGRDKAKTDERKGNYTTLVNSYYDLVTDFYEYGWGQSFHFAPRFIGESFAASLARHEHFLASRLQLKPGMSVLDVGSGVGGPMRCIARFSGAHVTGLNNNDYQVKRSEILNARYGLSHLCSTKKGDFMKLPFAPGTFDCVYQIEATCHAPDKNACFAQIFKALKSGGYFSGYEWIVTDKYDKENAEHRRVKHTIEYGNGLPELATAEEVVEALKSAGFEVIEYFDIAITSKKDGNPLGWYETLQGGMKLSQIKHSTIGRFCTQRMCDTMEFLHVAPKGTSETHRMLCKAAEALAAGGEAGIFTPMFYYLARKP